MSKQKISENRNFNEIKIKNHLLAEIGYKPRYSKYSFILLGLVLFFLDGMTAKIGGILFCLMGAFICFGIKDYKVAELYEVEIVLIQHETNERIKIAYANIKEWNIDDGIMILTKDGNIAKVESYASKEAGKILRQIMPDAETSQIRNLRNKRTKMKSPFEILGWKGNRE